MSDPVSQPDPRSRPESDVDPDVDLSDPAERREFATPHRAAVLGVIVVGGVAGALARYGAELLGPYRPEQWPWATFLVNLSGCLLIGVLMVVITERMRPHPLVRPLLVVGVLGGYTTFSTYTVDAVQAVGAGRAWLALGYVVATPVLAVLAVAAGMALARTAGRWAR